MVQRVRDPVHGLVVFGGGDDPYQNETDCIAWQLINTKEFQRLRRIRQLGFSDLVYPGATHSRFAHSIGVYHMARRLAGVITRRIGEGQRDRERERIALLAALVHDIGHGPFSHAFEAVSQAINRPKQHEYWSAEIIRDDQTGIHRALHAVDGRLPDAVSALLKEEPGDIYATIVSSQFDADRLDYIQRDRMMAGVEFGHIDMDWLLDSLEVRLVTIGTPEYDQTRCLCLGPKGVSVAEEYLESRYRLYQKIYMHKTTRAAERMLEALLKVLVEQLDKNAVSDSDPLAKYLTEASLNSYLKLDDSTVWASILAYSELNNPHVSGIAKRLFNRCLYKCVDVGVRDVPQGNLFLRVQRRLLEIDQEWTNDVLVDEPSITPYKWYDFDELLVLNKVLVNTYQAGNEPIDIANVSEIVRALRATERIQRLYVPNATLKSQLERIVREVMAA